MKTSKPMKRSRIKFKSRPRATAEELAHLSAVKAAGCVACWKNRLFSGCPTLESLIKSWGRDPSMMVEAHHLLDGGRRRGHTFTIGLCRWHHRGDVPDDQSKGTFRSNHGPSLAEGTSPFRQRYGTDSELLAFQAELLRLLAEPSTGNDG